MEKATQLVRISDGDDDDSPLAASGKFQQVDFCTRVSVVMCVSLLVQVN